MSYFFWDENVEISEGLSGLDFAGAYVHFELAAGIPFSTANHGLELGNSTALVVSGKWCTTDFIVGATT